MKIAVTTPTGNIGSVLSSRLLESGAELTLLARNPAKLKEFVDRGARAVQADLQDLESVTAALAGQEAVFWLSPPSYEAPDFRAYQKKLGKVAAEGVSKSGVKRVVNLSSVGAQLPAGTGPIAGLGDVEKLLNETGAHVRHLRAAYFMENILLSLETIKSMGAFFLPIDGDVKLPMVATGDIAAVAQRHLLDAGWTGKQTVGVHGPEDLSHNEVAAILTEVLSKPIQFMKVTPEQTREGMAAMGMPGHVIDVFLEMYEAMDTGRLVVAEPRTAETTTPTTFARFAQTVIKPLVG